MADRMGIRGAPDPAMAELKRNVGLEVVLKEMEDQAEQRAEQHAGERGKGAPSGEE